MRWHVLWLVVVLAGFPTACATYAERQEAVVGQARVYALRQFPELTEVQRHHVDFTKPRLLQRRILPREGPEFESGHDIMQTCVVWALPDSGGESLVVVGVAERKLADWRPLRALIRHYDKVEEEIIEAP